MNQSGDYLNMTNCSRLAALGAVLATLAVATPAFAAPVAASPTAKATAQIVKPLTFAAMADLNFGTIVLGSFTGNTGVSIGQASTSTTLCGASLTCSGTSQPAKYTVQATPGQPLTVRAVASKLTLVGAAAPAPTIDFTPASAPTVQVALGSTSHEFYVGGAIVITSTTPEGVYSGTMDVTVDYN
jgi:hypothetical protein